MTSPPHRPSTAQKLKIAPEPRATLTPKRKHRKMLKDGTSEVWPEDVEKVFVEGLRQYRTSPWANFSGGRSRWRNTYLVEYLQKAGITRTKKQVASHIQVLRNMWKGEKEYALVAGADESDDGCRKSTPGSADENDSDYSTASAPSPITPRSAGDEFTLHSAAASAGAGPSGLRIVTASVDSGFPAAASPVVKVEDGTDLVAASYHPHYYTPAHHAIPRAFGAMPLSGSPPLASPGGVILSPDLPLGPHGAYGLSPHAYSAPAMQRRTSSSSSAASASACTTRICNLTLCADGMSPLVIPVDAMAGAAFRLRLTLPNGVPVPAFVPGLTLTAPWSHATCTTRMNSGGVCISEERDPLQLPVGATPGMPTLAYLPPSVLNQSRLLEMDGSPITFTQRVAVDGATLAVLLYEVRRTAYAPGAGPVAECTGLRTWDTPSAEGVCDPPAPALAPHTAMRSMAGPTAVPVAATSVSAYPGLAAFGHLSHAQY